MTIGIYVRGPGQYLARIRQGVWNLTRTFETHEAARQWREVTVGQITGRTYVDREREQRTTLAQMLARYREEVTPTKDGARQERARLLAWEKQPFAQLPIISIEPSHIVEWRNDRLADGKAPSTISNSMNLLSAAYKKAIAEWSYKVTNPVTGISRPRPRPGREAHLSKADEMALRAACERGPVYLLWVTQLAIETAMRQGEIRRMEWRHIYATHIHLPKYKDTTGRRVMQARDVPLTTAAAEAVTAMRAALPERLDGWVFGDPDAPAAAGGLTEWMVQQSYADAVRLAMREYGMTTKLTFHDLRHVGITRLKPLHADMLDLAKTTGHKTISMLVRYYNPEIEARTKEIREREARRKA